MKTCASNLPVELWISIFHYLEIHDLFRAFTNLNNYFHSILASNHLSFHLKLEKTNHFSPWSKEILNRINSLKSSTYGQGKYTSQFLYWHGEKLIRLKSLTIEIHERELWPSCLEFIKSHSIEYLSLACIPNQILLDAILSSPMLYKCRLYFWQSTTAIKHCLNMNSTIEILYIKLKENSNYSIVTCLVEQMPKLKRLEIVGDHVHDNLNPLLDKAFVIFPQLERIKLIWLRRSMSLDYFERLLSIAPAIKQMYLGIYCYRLDESLFESLIQHWWPNLVRIPYVKILIRCHELAKTLNNDEQILFENSCRQIASTINLRTDVRLNIKWIEENCKTHTIKITIEKC